jgi:anaerobic selenocysteine-containing dehydrogenase
MNEVTRREFVRFLGAAGVWTLTGCGNYPGPKTVAPVPMGWNRGEERWVASTCLQCPGGCGIQVRVYEGRAIKIEGNPEHPLNRGGLCPKGQAGLQALYDPDRIPGPMRKIGGRSSSRWESISWDEALETVAKRLRRLRAAGEPERLLLMGGRFPGHMRALFGRLAHAYGTPNLIDTESLCNRARLLAMRLQQGIHALPGYDLERTRYFMVFGAGFLEAWRPTGYLLRMYGAMRAGRPGRRAKIVVVDPRCGVGASKADQWIPIRPGTDGALALGMAHVIIREDLFDRDFVEKHTFGFDVATDGGSGDGTRIEGFRSMVLREYPPARVAEITGVPGNVIERVAREFAEARPAIAAAGRGPALHTNGLFANMAIHSLNALVGSLEVPGGVVVQDQPPFRPWRDAAPDETAMRGLARTPIADPGPEAAAWPTARGVHGTLLDSLLGGQACPIDTALVYYTNPLFSGPDTARYREAFDRIPFLVSFSPFMDDTTARADLVLPDGTYLERLEDDFIPPSVGYPVLNLRRPVVQPLHDTLHTGDVLIRLARGIGGSVGNAFPWPSYEGALKAAVAGVADLHDGSFAAPDAEVFWKRLKARGVWSRGPYRYRNWKRAFRTPTGKFEFVPQAWKRRVEELALKERKTVDDVLGELGIKTRGVAAFMPHHEPPRFAGDAKRYPLHLHTYKTMMHAEGRGANQPWLQESFGVQLGECWRPWAEMNPQTARKLGIGDEDKMWLESERGRLEFRARLHPGVRPDVVNVPFEYGHTAYGRWGTGIRGNPNEITAGVVDPATGVHALQATRVRVYRA